MKPVTYLLLLLSLLTGCGGNYYGSNSGYGGGDSVDVDDLLEFQASFADKSPSVRADECRRMLKQQQQSAQPGSTLRLMIGRPLSEACGDPGRLVRSYESLRSKRYLGRATEGFGNYQSKVLQRMAGADRAGSRAGNAQKQGKDESRVLREKLEAIRNIEKELDQRNSEDSPR